MWVVHPAARARVQSAEDVRACVAAFVASRVEVA